MEPPPTGQIKAGGQGLAGVAPPVQPLPPQPQHHPLIRLRRINHRPVNLVARHQQQIPRAEEIGHTLHHISHLAAQQKDDLVKFVIVVLQRLRAGVLQVKQTKILQKISPLIRFQSLRHGPFPLPVINQRNAPSPRPPDGAGRQVYIKTAAKLPLLSYRTFCTSATTIVPKRCNSMRHLFLILTWRTPLNPATASAILFKYR
ncbi:hypothetical protein SDC9_144227 [bioreactor metagenome]|uniref:Uncharacterized protein n=1 Tax=bioreactor metagenome TaxID=1076179 RepID=A0A645E5H3_9ZZZZ